jgi:dienelactone hydrolase
MRPCHAALGFMLLGVPACSGTSSSDVRVLSSDASESSDASTEIALDGSVLAPDAARAIDDAGSVAMDAAPSGSDWVTNVRDIEFVDGPIVASAHYIDLSPVEHPVLPAGTLEDALNAMGVNPNTLQRRLAFPKNRSEWEAKRPSVIAAVDRSLGVRPPFPRRVIVQIDGRAHRTTMSGIGYTTTRFRFHNGADAVVPGVLVVPDRMTGERVPLIVYCHYHGGEFDVGKESLFMHGRLWPRSNQNHDFPETRNVDPMWLGDWPAGIGNLAELLMSRGYAVMSIDEYAFRERSGKGPNGPGATGEAEIDSFDQLFRSEGRTRFGMGVRDKQIALEWASRQPGIDRTKRAVTGMSMGSWNSMNMAFAEPTLNPVIPVAGLFTRDAALLATLAPERSVLNMNGDRDPGNAPTNEVMAAKGLLDQIYGYYGQGQNYQNFIVANLGHELTMSETRRALELMRATWMTP